MLRSTAQHIDEASTAMGTAPALWHSWPNRPEYDIESELLGRGFTFLEEEPVMTMALQEALPVSDRKPAARLRTVDDEAGLASWVRLWTGSEADDATLMALASVGLGGRRAVHHMLAEVDGIAVGCGAAVVAGDAVAVEHIVTSASHRRQGIGTQLTVAALAIGRDRGARTAVLTASPKGVAIYRRLGFVDQDLVRRFVSIR